MMQTQPPAPPVPAAAPKPFKRPACNSCRVAHVACENARPCHRCSLLGKAELCQDANVKKRGRPRKSASSSPGAPKSGSAVPKSSSGGDEENGTTTSVPAPKRVRTETKPSLPAVLPRPTSTTTTPTTSTSSSSIAASSSDSASAHHSSSSSSSSSAPSSSPADLPRLPPPASLLRLGQQGDFSAMTPPTTLPPLPPLSSTSTTPPALLYPSFIISLFQNAAGITPIAPATSQAAVSAATSAPKPASAQTTTASAPPAGPDPKGGLTEANLIMILDSIKEIRETNEQLRKEMTEIKNENAQLKKEKEELRAKLEEHLAQDLQLQQPRTQPQNSPEV